jgi:hypothetical protein
MVKNVRYFHRGDVVTFQWAGMESEVKGIVVSRGRTKLKVQQEDEEFWYTRRKYAKGTVWTVHPDSCWKVKEVPQELQDQAQRVVSELSKKPELFWEVHRLLRTWKG